MKYSLVKLRFTTAVHFGYSDSALSLYSSTDFFCADTLFSALCHTALSLGGPDAVEKLCRQVQCGDILLSDSMPWKGGMLFLPKPVITAESRQELPMHLRKAMKKLKWIPVESFNAFSKSLHGGQFYDASKYPQRFGEEAEMAKARCVSGQDAVPYQVGIFQFYEDCGLSVLIGYKTDNQMQQLIKLLHVLGLSGLGGKTSSGYGRFQIAEVISIEQSDNQQINWLYHALTAQQSKCFLLLTTSLPQQDELEKALEGAFFQLTRRGGFMYPDMMTKAAEKKQTQYFIGAGAVLSNRFMGDLYEVCPSAPHPVYRYSKPIFLGVEL